MCISLINLKDASQTEFLEVGPTLNQEEVNVFIEKYEKLLEKAKEAFMEFKMPGKVKGKILLVNE